MNKYIIIFLLHLFLVSCSTLGDRSMQPSWLNEGRGKWSRVCVEEKEDKIKDGAIETIILKEDFSFVTYCEYPRKKKYFFKGYYAVAKNKIRLYITQKASYENNKIKWLEMHKDNIYVRGEFKRLPICNINQQMILDRLIINWENLNHDGCGDCSDGTKRDYFRNGFSFKDHY